MSCQSTKLYNLSEQEKSLHEDLGVLEKLFEESNEKVVNPVVFIVDFLVYCL